jgi:hypothetical protein
MFLEYCSIKLIESALTRVLKKSTYLYCYERLMVRLLDLAVRTYISNLKYIQILDYTINTILPVALL